MVFWIDGFLLDDFFISCCYHNYAGGDEEPAAKRSRSERVEGERLIQQFVLKAQELVEGSLPEAVVRATMEDMKREISTSDNAYVKAVIQSCV